MEAAAAVTSGTAAHYCQGFEGATPQRAEHPPSWRRTGYAIPCFALSPHLAVLVRKRFGRPARVVPPALAPYLATCLAAAASPKRRGFSWPTRSRSSGKAWPRPRGRAHRYGAAGLSCQLVRLSQWPLGAAERAMLEPDEFHHHLDPRRLPDSSAALTSACALLGAGRVRVAGTGGNGVWLPVVASDISAFRAFAGTAAVLVPPDRPEAFAEAARAILGDPGRWRAMRRRGLEAAQAFSEGRVARTAQDALYWVAEGQWTRET